ncbi:disco-interacting protein 2 homolog C-like [Salmo trutta]|uniref:disco-interacting protein 2 homolog C-like n=1 Tax=Salmo trutta TaxID=8032 RepID=UPI001130225D|nr:disco-interacting protein 2 homolog C-like [Salmo trutta]
MAEREASPLPLEVRARLAELELELSEGDITQKGYEKKRSKLIRALLSSSWRYGGYVSPPPLCPPSAAPLPTDGALLEHVMNAKPFRRPQ